MMRFTDFVTAAYRRLADLDPGFAIQSGDLNAGGALPPGHAGFAAERALCLGAIAGEAAAFAAEAPVDVAHLQRAAALEAFAQLECGERLANPDVLTPLGEWITAVLFAPYAREEDRYQRLASMVSEIPGYLAAAVTTFGEPDPLWQDIAGEVAESFGAIFTALPEGARGRASPACAEALARHCRAAEGALADFRRALGALKPGRAARVLGRDRFAELLKLKAIPGDLQDLREFGTALFRHLHEERGRAAKAIVTFGDARAALRALKEHHPPTFAAALDAVRALAREARDFVQAQELCEVPRDEELVVVETPAFARPLIPFAAIMTAKALWPLARSTYYVTRPASGDLSELHDADLRNVVPHEAYPGHHLHFAVANQRGALARNLPWTAGNLAQLGVDTIEGWAHYGEALMKEHGFYAGAGDRFLFLNDALWRAARVLIDLGLATGEMTLDQAALMLCDEVGMAKEGARSEVRRYALMPGYNLCYAYGKYLIGELRRDAERAWGRGFSLARFHALIMTNGMAPLAAAGDRLRASG